MVDGRANRALVKGLPPRQIPTVASDILSSLGLTIYAAVNGSVFNQDSGLEM